MLFCACHPSFYLSQMAMIFGSGLGLSRQGLVRANGVGAKLPMSRDIPASSIALETYLLTSGTADELEDELPQLQKKKKVSSK